MIHTREKLADETTNESEWHRKATVATMLQTFCAMQTASVVRMLCPIRLVGVVSIDRCGGGERGPSASYRAYAELSVTSSL